MKRSLFLNTLVALCAVASSTLALAQSWPTKPVKLVLGAPAGTAPDTAARIMAERLGALWGQPILIENKPGAGGMIAMESVKSAAPDGYTLMFAHAGAVLVTPKLLKAAKYDPVNDFATLGFVADSPMVIVANNEIGGKSLAELISAAKAKPGQIAFGSTETGTLPFLVGHGLSDATGITLQHVPFNQPATAIQSLVKGDLQYYVDGIAPLLPLVKSGRMRAIAVTSDKRLTGLEDIPLIKDTVPGYVAVGWFALMGPKGLPADMAQKINRDMNQVLAQPEVVSKYRDISLFSTARNQAESATLMKSEVERWAATIRKVGLEAQ